MSASLPTEQLLELLVQLKRATPTAAKEILNGQPQIAYALMSLMVNMNAVNVEVCQKILSDYSASTAPLPSIANPIAPQASVTPTPAIPPHLQPQAAYRNETPPTTTGTPPVHPPTPQTYPTPPYSNGQYPTPPTGYPPQQGYNYAQPPSVYPGYPPSYPPQQGAPPAGPSPDILAGIPEDQRALLMRVISMSPEEINRLPPSERSTYVQLRAHLGITTG